jgi:20S proteasome alpha/beta subunit
MVSSFKLRGNVAYDEILSQVSEAEVDKAIKLMVSAFQEAVRDGLTTAEVEPRARAVLRVANKEGRRMIKERIAKIYSEA